MPQTKASTPTPTTLEWFAGANSRYGFFGAFDSIFSLNAFDRIYIIIGAPGTGKSRLMREIYQALHPFITSAELFYCSSDHHSLDGVILKTKDKKIGILDGTPPHPRNPTLAGVYESIVDLGRFWNRDLITSGKEELKKYAQAKKCAYAEAYTALGLLGSIEEVKMKSLKRAFLFEKCNKTIKRLLKPIRLSSGEKEIRYLSAIGMTGTTTLTQTVEKIETVYAIPPFYGYEHLCLDMLKSQLELQKAKYVSIPKATDPNMLEGIFLPENNCLFVCGQQKNASHVINPTRFVSAAEFRILRPFVRSLTEMSFTVQERCLCALKQAGEAHLSMEQIYASSMNFGEKESFTQSLIATVKEDLGVISP